MSAIVPIINGFIPIPLAEREGFGIRPGSRLLASAFVDGLRRRPAEGEDRSKDRTARSDLFGGLLISPVRKTVLLRMVKMTFAVENEIGALRSMTTVIKNEGGNILFLQGAGNGVCHCHVYFPDLPPVPASPRWEYEQWRSRLQAFDANPRLRSLLITLPGRTTTAYKAIKEAVAERTLEKISWVERSGVIETIIGDCYDTEGYMAASELGGSASRLYVKEEGIPFPLELFERIIRVYGRRASKSRGAEASVLGVSYDLERWLQSPPKNVILAEEKDELAITCLIPRRPCLRVSVQTQVVATEANPGPGVGVVDQILEVLQKNGINVLHADINSSELRFRSSAEETGKGNWSGDRGASADEPTVGSQAGLKEPDRPRMYGERGTIDIIGTFPDKWGYQPVTQLTADIETLVAELKGLRFGGALEGSLAEQRLKAAAIRIRQLNRQSGAPRLPEIWTPPEWNRYVAGLSQIALGLLADSDDETVRRDLVELVDELMHISASSMPSSPHRVLVRAAPTARCFLARSSTPEDQHEERFVGALKALLGEFFYEVADGLLTLGESIAKATRERIKECDALVSIVWPRVAREGAAAGPQRLHASDWIIHEESFAMGRGLAVYRFREERAEAPSYQRDMDEFMFAFRDETSWEHAFTKARRELGAFLLRRTTG